jgi:hypothetical protein
MNKLFRILLTAAVMAAAVAIYAGVASGDKGGNGNKGKAHHHGKRHGAPLLKESMAPSEPTDPTFHGVAPGTAPWVLTRGNVQLKRDGKFRLNLRGLVIPPPTGNNTPGPVTTVSASLYCGDNATSTTPADTTAAVPLSSTGDARIRDNSFTVPATCLAPVILVHPNGLMNLYIAVDGWRP